MKGRRSTRGRSRRSSGPRSLSTHAAERQGQGERSRRGDSAPREARYRPLWFAVGNDRAIFTPMGEYSAGALDRVFSAVSDGTRRAILARLAVSDARVTDVAGAFPISLNSTSKHIP